MAIIATLSIVALLAFLIAGLAGAFDKVIDRCGRRA